MPPRRRSRQPRRPAGNAWRQAAAAIDRFVPENTPLGRLDEGNMLLRVTGGNIPAAKWFAALSRKESEFGRTAFTPNNYIGWGIHSSPAVHAANNPEEIYRRAWKFVTKPGSPYSRARTAGELINVWAPPVENNTSLYQNQVNQWLTQMGTDPRTPIRGPGARTAQSAGSPVASDPGAGLSSPAPGSLPQLSSLDGKALMRLLQQATQGALRGEMPGPAYSKGLNRIAQTLRASVQQAAQQAPQGQADPTRQMASVPGAAPGGVSQGAGIYTTPYGGWAGTEGPVQALTKLSGLTVSSAKRARRNTVSGSMSDHYQGNTTAYAHDLSATPGARGDNAASRIVEALGGPKGWGKRGGVFNTTINGIRFQVLWKTMTGGNHYDHIHLGARRT